MHSLRCLLGIHRETIKHAPDRLECKRCGRTRVVHQDKPRNAGNGHNNRVCHRTALE